MDEARRRLRERGLPQTPMYLDAELERMQPWAGGLIPRAEPDQVVRSAARDDRGLFVGRKKGAITTGMVDKQDVNAPTNEGSTWQMDLMDMSTRGVRQVSGSWRWTCIAASCTAPWS